MVLVLVVISALAFGSFFSRMLLATAAILAIPALFVLYLLIGAYTTVAIAMLAILGWLVLSTIADLCRHVGDDRRLESGTRRTGADLLAD